MRKIFTSLKSVVSAVVIAAMAFSVSCSYDDAAINNRVDKVENDLKALTERVDALEKKLGTEVESLKALIDGKVVIVEVTTDEAGNTTIKLSDGKTITVLAPEECKYVPCDHECTPCDCDSLEYRVVDGVLEVSADGENWVAINGVSADQVVADVVLNEDGTATIKLANGDEFTVVKAELIECEAARTGVYVLAGGSRDVAFSINDAVVDINIMNQPFGWSASIEEAPEAPEAGDDSGAIAPMPLAAGGKNYVLTINGPAASLKEAAKEGVVSVHFNTAAGACKVLSVNVNLAELTLNVDMAGNITLINTLAESAGVDELGNPMYDFVDFFIGVVDAADYAAYGDHVFAETFDDWEYEYTANVASTNRSTGFQNIVDLMFYEDGVCEKESYTLTVDQLANAFWPKYNFELGKEYIIFATTESEMKSYVEHPVLTSAVKANYKRVSVEAKIVEDSVTWNNATAEFNLAGYNLFSIGWIPVAQLEELVLYGMAEDLNSALAFYLAADNGYMNAAIVPETKGTYKLSELAAISMTGWAPEIMSDTEYIFFVYPLNAQTEMDLYMHQFVKENLVNCGTFRTAALKVGNFDAGAKIEATIEEDAVGFTATFSEDIVTVAWVVSEQSYMDPEEAALAILGNLYTQFVTFDEEITSVDGYKGYWGARPEPLYLAMLAINAAGEYVYVEYEFKEEGAEEPETSAASAKASLVTDTTFGGFNPYDVTFSFENGDQVIARFNTSGNQYLHLGDWQADSWQNPHYISQVKYNGEYAAITACNVAYENDAYVVTLSVFEYTNYTTIEYTYTGAIEGLNAPEACDCLDPEEPENPEGGEGDVINITIQNLTVGYDQPGEKELQFWYSATNAHVIDFKGFDNCNPGQPLAAGTYSSEDYTIDANYCIFDYGTTNGGMSDVVVVVTDNGDGTYTYDAKFSHSGKKYAFVYTGAFPQ